MQFTQKLSHVFRNTLSSRIVHTHLPKRTLSLWGGTTVVWQTMRYVIFLLVALNGIYFTWGMLNATPGTQDTYPIPPLPPDVRRLVMLQEQTTDETPSTGIETSKIENLTAKEPPGALTSLSCHALGPILAQSELKSLEQRLGKLGLNASPQTRYVQEQVGYAVLLPPKEYDEAVRIKQQLKKDNFTANIVSRRNEISLGAFRDKSQAERTFTRADGMGLSPRIEPSYANRSTYWLVFGRGDNDDAELAALKKKYPDLHVEIQACP